MFGDGQAAHEHGLFGGFGAQAAAFPGVGEPGVFEALRDAFPACVLAAGAQLVEEFVDGVGVDAEALLQFARGPGGFAGADDLAFPVHLVDDVDHGAHGGGLAAARGADHAADEAASGEHGGARVFLVAAEWMVRSGRIIGEQVAHAPSCLPVRGFVEALFLPHGFDVFLVLGEFGRVPALLGRTVGSGDSVEDADAWIVGHARVDLVADRVDGDACVEHPVGERAHEPVARAGGVEADAGGEPFGRGHDACGGECGVVAGHFPTDLFDHVPFARLWRFGQVACFGVLPHLFPQQSGQRVHARLVRCRDRGVEADGGSAVDDGGDHAVGVPSVVMAFPFPLSEHVLERADGLVLALSGFCPCLVADGGHLPVVGHDAALVVEFADQLVGAFVDGGVAFAVQFDELVGDAGDLHDARLGALGPGGAFGEFDAEALAQEVAAEVVVAFAHGHGPGEHGPPVEGAPVAVRASDEVADGDVRVQVRVVVTAFEMLEPDRGDTLDAFLDGAGSAAARAGDVLLEPSDRVLDGLPVAFEHGVADPVVAEREQDAHAFAFVEGQVPESDRGADPVGRQQPSLVVVDPDPSGLELFVVDGVAQHAHQPSRLFRRGHAARLHAVRHASPTGPYAGGVAVFDVVVGRIGVVVERLLDAVEIVVDGAGGGAEFGDLDVQPPPPSFLVVGQLFQPSPSEGSGSRHSLGSSADGFAS